MRVDIWSDIVCPWCYIGKRRFEKALAGFERRNELQVVHRSFQLDPTMPKGQLFRHRDVLMGKYGMTEPQVAAAQSRLVELAATEGLEYHLSRSYTGNTLDAHRLVHHAAGQGLQDAMIERLFRAHFTELKSIFDNESLTALAEEVGLTGSKEVLTSDAYAADVVTDHGEANRLGASGVPFFLIDGRYGISGAQATEVFAGAIRTAAPR